MIAVDSFPGDNLFDEDEQRFRREFRQWLEAHPSPARPGTVDRTWMDTYAAWHRSMAEAGYAALHWPEEFGGAAKPVAHQLVQLEEFAATGTDPKVLMAGLYLVAPVLMAIGTVEQQDAHLSKILYGHERWCLLLSEPNAGSDLLSVTTRGQVEGDHISITGQKIWTSYGHVADYALILMRTDPGSKGARGLTLAIVDMASAGVTVRPIRQITGEAEFNEVFLDEVIVPVENVIGEVNSGTRALMVLLSAERTGLSMAGYAVLAAGLKEIATRVVSSGSRDLRVAFTRAWSAVAVQRLTAMRSVSNMHDPEGSFASASAAKLQNAKNSQALAALDLQALGIEGIAYPEADRESASISKKFVRSPADSIGGGTSEVQKNTVAERVLGLPK